MTIFKILILIFPLVLSPITQELNEENSAAPKEWTPLFDKDLSNAIYQKGVWSMEKGVLTASEDLAIWSKMEYENFELKLEFKNAKGTNSGVFLYGDIENWLTNSIEVQIADDYDARWANSPKNWQCGAIFGHQDAVDTQIVKQPGEWNTYHIIAKGPHIKVILNDVEVNQINMDDFTTATENPDGSPVPEWLSVPLSQIARKGHIGFQGKHAGKPIWFRNIMVRNL